MVCVVVCHRWRKETWYHIVSIMGSVSFRGAHLPRAFLPDRLGLAPYVEKRPTVDHSKRISAPKIDVLSTSLNRLQKERGGRWRACPLLGCVQKWPVRLLESITFVTIEFFEIIVIDVWRAAKPFKRSHRGRQGWIDTRRDREPWSAVSSLELSRSSQILTERTGWFSYLSKTLRGRAWRKGIRSMGNSDHMEFSTLLSQIQESWTHKVKDPP